MFGETGRARSARCRVLYVSPLKALAVDIERNLRAPLAGIANRAARAATPITHRRSPVRTGDTPGDRARAIPARSGRHPDHDAGVALPAADVERARGAASVDTVIVDEIHALVPTKRGAHMALSLERLEAIRPAGASPLQRIGLSATQRPLDEVARFLGGAASSIDLRQTCTAVSRCHDRRHVGEEAARSEDRSPGRGHGEDRPAGSDPERPRVARDGTHVDLDRDPSAAPRLDQGAPIDAHLRQQPADGGAARQRAQRARRRSRSSARITARWRGRSGSRSKIG